MGQLVSKLWLPVSHSGQKVIQPAVGQHCCLNGSKLNLCCYHYLRTVRRRKAPFARSVCGKEALFNTQNRSSGAVISHREGFRHRMAYTRNTHSAPSTTAVRISRETMVGSDTAQRRSARLYSFPANEKKSARLPASMHFRTRVRRTYIRRRECPPTLRQYWSKSSTRKVLPTRTKNSYFNSVSS